MLNSFRRNLAGFMRRPELVISTTPGFTWGDGVYVVRLQHVYSAMIYGRVGVMGWIGRADLTRVYDAADPAGVSLTRNGFNSSQGCSHSDHHGAFAICESAACGTPSAND